MTIKLLLIFRYSQCSFAFKQNRLLFFEGFSNRGLVAEEFPVFTTQRFSKDNAESWHGAAKHTLTRGNHLF